MHDELWAGVELKLRHAEFHFDHMSRSLAPPDSTGHLAAMIAMGTIIDTNWQLAFFAYFDAFLSSTRSIAEVIRCCFGVDPLMTKWLALRPDEERERRSNFSKQFKSHYDQFRNLPLSNARNVSLHRIGYPPAKVEIDGQFGVKHVGSPIERIPISEAPQIKDPSLAWMAKPRTVQPDWSDFTIDGQPLFDVCQEYLQHARKLVEQARYIAISVHGNQTLSVPAA
jgi:hypothetical protein